MKTITTTAAFKSHGIRAEYQGHPAMILPVTKVVHAMLNKDEIRQGVDVGQVLVGWQDESGTRKGNVLNSDAHNDLTFVFPRKAADAEPLHVRADNLGDGVLRALHAKRQAKNDAVRVESENAEAQAEHERLVARGEAHADDAPELAEPEFDQNAFDGLTGLADMLMDVEAAIVRDPLVDRVRMRKALSFISQINALETRSEVTSQEAALIDEVRSVKAEIGAIAPDHSDAAEHAMPRPYDGDGEAAENLIGNLPIDPEGVTAEQMHAMTGGLDFNLVTRLFSMATSTPAGAIRQRRLSHAGMKRVAQDFAKWVDHDATAAIIPRMQAVTREAMGEEYVWEGRIFSKAGADLLLMRDAFTCVAYVWDTASRVGHVNVEAALNDRYRKAKVPTQDELARLRRVLSELRYDNGAVIDFDWDDEDEEILAS